MNGFIVCSLISLVIYLIQYDWSYILLFSLMFSLYLLLEKKLVPSHALKLNNLRRRLAIATWGDPDSPECHGHGHIRVEKALEYLENFKKKTGLDLSLGQLLSKAASDSLGQFKDMNGRIAFGCFIPGESSNITLLKSIDSGSNFEHIFLPRCNEKSILEVAQHCTLAENKGKVFTKDSIDLDERLLKVFNILPSFLSGPLLETLSFIVNSMGLDVPQLGVKRMPFGGVVIMDLQDVLQDISYPVLMPFMRSSIFCSISSIKEVPAVEAGKIVTNKVITLAFTGDHRFGDGTRALKAMQGFKQRLEAPFEFYPID